MPQFKRCSLCEELKPIECFGKDKNSKDGYAYWCKICRVKHQREYSLSEKGKSKIKEWERDNAESIKEKRRQYNHTPQRMALHRERVRVYKKTEAGKATDRRWRNSEKGIAYMKNFWLEHPNYHIEWAASHPNYKKERYHWLQDKYNCYGSSGDPRNWFPIARQMDALLTAPIVEVKA